MRTRSQVRKRRQQQVRQTSVESPNLEKPNNNQETFNPPIVTMDDNRTMAQLLEAPTEGYEDAIVVPEINANNFEIKHGLLNLVQNKQFFGHDKEDPHAHIRYFNKITSTMKFPNVPSTSVKLMLFLFSLEGAARIWLDKEPPQSILTWDDLVSKFINKFFPPSKTTNLRNEITRFQQRFDESFYEAWDRFNDLLRACPHHGFSELHQLDTFYNALNTNDQDSLNSAAGGNFLDKMPENVQKNHRRANPQRFAIHEANPSYQAPVYQASIPQTQGVSKTDFDSYVKANDAVMRNMQNQNQVLQNQGQNLQAQLNNLATSNQRVESMLSNFIKMNTASTSGSGTLPGNTITNPKEDLKGITTRSGVAYQGPAIPSTSSSPPKVMNRDTEVTKDTMLPNNNGSTEDVQPPVIQVQSQNPTSKPVVDPVSTPMPDQRTSIPFPSRRNDERRREKANDQIEKFYEIFRDLSFEISFTDALTLMPKFASTLKTLIGNKEKLSEMARTPLNENCSAVILNKLPKKLGDPGRFLIPCEFSGINTCNALADLGASINLMPYSVWKDLSSRTNPDLHDARASRPDFLPLEEANAFIAINDELILREINATYYDPPGEGDNKLPVIIAKDLKDEEKAAFIKVLKSHKRAIAWKLSDIKGIDPEFCTHKILMERD
ncbi:reverse transcriptase domain-containing protein [Tanacetum coccineum]